MSDRSDSELLSEFCRRGCQAAFGELAARYAGLVYTAALRQVRDRHAAEDVSQAVFIVLAKRAETLRPNVVLGAWLLAVTRFAARDLLKTESRRRKREQIAAAQRNAEMTRDSEPNSVSRGGPFDDVLDDAMMKLGASSRDVLVLRYFQDKPFDQVAVQLGITEQAARQRVSRGLEKLRQILARRGGIRIQSDGLGMALATTAVAAAPQGLVTRLAAAAATGGAAAGPAAALAKGVVSVMAYSGGSSCSACWRRPNIGLG